MVMEKNIVKENNGGGLSIERWINDEISEVVCGLEFGDQGNGLNDLLTFGDDWTAEDCGGNTVGYYENGNTSGDTGHDGEELTADDVIDDDDTTQTIAEYDGETVTLYVTGMGNAGKRYFGINR